MGYFSIIKWAPQNQTYGQILKILRLFFKIVFTFKLFKTYTQDVGKHGKKVSVLIPGPVFCFAEVFKLHYELFGKSKKCTINSISVPTYTSARTELNVSTHRGATDRRCASAQVYKAPYNTAPLLLPPPRSILQNQGKTAVLLVLPYMAPLI